MLDGAGPYGEQDDEQLFVQQVVPDSDQLYVRLASTGKRVCVIRSVDGTMITSFCVHECEGSSRMGSRPRRVLFTGHANGVVQIWDLSTALDLSTKAAEASFVGGPTANELIRSLEQCEVVGSGAVAPSPPLAPQPFSRFGSHNHDAMRTPSADQTPLLHRIAAASGGASHVRLEEENSPDQDS